MSGTSSAAIICNQLTPRGPWGCIGPPMTPKVHPCHFGPTPWKSSLTQIVKEIALKHWEEITVTKPSKHCYVSKAVRDGNETVPTRYQTMTNEESYESFKETCIKEVKGVMVKHSEEMTTVYEKRKASPDKDYRIKYAPQQVPQSVLVAWPAPQWCETDAWSYNGTV